KFAYLAMRITCFLPIVETLRNVHRGLAISHERTKIVSAATAVRLIAIIIFLWWSVKTQLIPGVVAGGLAWTAGIGIEGLMVYAGVLYHFSSPVTAAEKMPKKNKKELKYRDIITFFVPLAAMMFFLAVLRPLIQSGIARSQVNTTQALAAFGVAFGIMRIIVGPMRFLHHCSLVYVGENDYQRWKKVKRFCLFTGLIVTGVMLLLTLTPVAFWILRHIIGVSEPVADLGQLVLLAFSFLPIILSSREAYWGLLMEQKTTKIIGYAKGLNVLTVFIILFSVIGIVENFWISSAVIGAIAYTLGQMVETFVICLYSSRNIKPAVNTKVLDI
ncbi:MAG: hypothetical protein ACOC1S_03640, partial [bacterium]